MTDNRQLSTAEVEQILLDIRQREQRISAEKKRRDETIYFYQQFIEQAKTNFDDATTDDQNEIELLKVRLQHYFNENQPVGRKSLKFAAGSFGYNKSQTKFFFNGSEVNANNQEFAKFCVESGRTQFIKTKEYLDWAAVKKLFDFDDPNTVVLTDTGEIIDGLRAEKIFSVKTLGGTAS